MSPVKEKSIVVKKRFIIPLWIFQILSSAIIIASAVYNIIYYNSDEAYKEEGQNDPAKFKSTKDKHQGLAIYFTVFEIITLVLILVEIVVFARRKLGPVKFFWLTMARTILNVPIWIQAIIRANVDGLDATEAVVSIIYLVLLVSYVLSVIYVSILLHRHRRNNQSKRKGFTDPSLEAQGQGEGFEAPDVLVDSGPEFRHQIHGRTGRQSGEGSRVSGARLSSSAPETAYEPYRHTELPTRPHFVEHGGISITEVDGESTSRAEIDSEQISEKPKPAELSGLSVQRYELDSVKLGKTSDALK